MGTDPTRSTEAIISAMIRGDPSLADPSSYVKAFSANLNDRQGEAEKSTPETEWRRVRDIWGKLSLASKAMMGMCRELERHSDLISQTQKKTFDIIEPSTNPYDPITGAGTGGGAGAGGAGGSSYVPTDLTSGLNRMRSVMADITQIALESRGVLDAYVPAIHFIAEQVAQLGSDAKARMDAMVLGGGGVTDHGALTGLGDDDHTQYLLVNGSRAMTGVLDAGSNKIVNTDDPTNPQDVATKAYVDGLPGSPLTTKGDIYGFSTVNVRIAVGANGTIPVADSGQAAGWSWKAQSNIDHGSLGGLSDDDHTQYTKADGTRAFTGNQSFGSHKATNLLDPSSAQDGATKNYVDTALGAYFKKDGSVAMTGAINAGAHQIHNVVDPTSDQDVATKKWVTDHFAPL